MFLFVFFVFLTGMDTVIRELLPQQQPRTIERRDLQYITISKEELTSSDSLSPDPWKRDAREKAEKQQQLHIVDLLDKEIQELQVRPADTLPKTFKKGLDLSFYHKHFKPVRAVGVEYRSALALPS